MVIDSLHWARRAMLLATLATATLLSFGVAVGAAAAERNYILATAGAGGTYYPVGVGLATLVKLQLMPTHQINMSAITSAGSGENLLLMREDEAQFSFMNSLIASEAWAGLGVMEGEGPADFLRSITVVWPNVEQWMVTKDVVETGTLDDLENLRDRNFAIGMRGSGTEANGRRILAALGIDPDGSFRSVHQNYEQSVNDMQNGTLAGMNAPGGPPMSAITQAYAVLGDDVVMLEFTEEQIAKINGDLRLWSSFVIPAGTYPNQAEDLKTAATVNFLSVRHDVDDEAVYLVTKALYENLLFLVNINRGAAAIQLETALHGLPVPLHPGAVRYYHEVGLDIPDYLLED